MHVDDICGALLHCLNLPAGQRPPVVNVVDDEPCPASEQLGYAALLLGCKLPVVQPFATARANLSPMALSFWQENRRVSNALLCQVLGYRLREPDLTLWFELPPEVAAQRLTGARLPDRFEAQPLAFFQAVHQGYEQRAQAAPQRIRRIDASASRHQVWQQITRLLVQKGWLSIMVPVPAALQIQSS